MAALLAVASPAASAACSNEQFRTGPAARLPDCRAYELVTAPKVNGIPEAAAAFGAGSITFSTPSVAPEGQSYMYSLVITSLPGPEANGQSNLYEARRTADGWSSVGRSPGGAEAAGFQTGGVSQDQHFPTFEINASRGGSLAFCPGCNPVYVGFPDGSYHLLGEGTIPALVDTDGFENGLVDDPHALPRWITAGATHQIFESAVQLLPEAAATGTGSVYDRTPTGLKLVSRLPEPGEPGTTIAAKMVGASADGSTVLFASAEDNLSEPDLFARFGNSKTVKLASHLDGPLRVGGVSADGAKIFFVKSGEVFVYDRETGDASAIPGTNGATLAGISADGSHAYFVSEAELVPGKGTVGQPNLYVWTGGSVQFIATVTAYDMEHSLGNPGEFQGLAAWTQELGKGFAAENSNRILSTGRSTPDGSFFAFESNAQLTSYPNEGHSEIYRYDTATQGLDCVSCSPTQPAATADSELAHAGQSGTAGFLNLNHSLEVPNLSSDGQQVVFQSNDALLPQDVNGVADVYEWRDGKLSLISSGDDPQPSLLTGVTPTGSDIFFRTGVRLVGKGQETGSPAIYDARIGGGIASQQADQSLPCQGEACQGMPAGPPSLSPPASSLYRGKGNVKQHKRHHHRHKQHKKKRRKRGGPRKSHRPVVGPVTRSVVSK